MNQVIRLILFSIGILLFRCQNPLEVDSRYTGGNIILNRISGDTVFVEPDTSNSSTDWFYWNFKVRNAGGRNLVFQFSQPDKISSLGPAVSADQGKTWRWLGNQGYSDRFSYTFQDDREVQFCTAIPYTLGDWNRFIGEFKDNLELESGTWCTTAENRDLPYLSIKPPQTTKNLVVITARHHACEMMASYVLEGIISKIMSKPGRFPDSEFLILPLMDLDGVENGDQGKNRIPRDHNRDYRGESIYCSTKKLREFLISNSDKQLIVFDLHNPWIRNKDNEYLFFTGIDQPEIEQELKRFAVLLDSVQTGPIRFSQSNILSWGTSWYKEGIYDPGYSLQKFTSLLPNAQLTTTLEIPYAISSGDTVTDESARQFGADLVNALSVYLDQVQ